MQLSELPTPQVLIDRKRLVANIGRMQRAATDGGIALRPHTKTHKSPLIARWQLDHGAQGICCAKIGEAEVFADAGCSDIRLPYPINPSNATRLAALMDRVHLSIAIDHLRVAETWSRFMVEHGKQLDVLVKVDVGYHRCGIDPDLQTAVKFLQHTASLQGLRLRGLLSHAGHSYNAKSDDERVAIAKDEAAILRNLANESRRVGVAIDEISVGSTPTALISASETGLTELRAGSYVYYDRSQVAIGSATLKDCALSVLATVVSKPAEDRLILDCGSKILTSDTGRGKVRPKGYGAVFTKLETTTPDDTLFIDRLSEEHAVVMAQNGSSRLEPGDRVRILPNHSCVVSNLVDTVYLVDDLTVVQSIPITARGKVT